MGEVEHRPGFGGVEPVGRVPRPRVHLRAVERLQRGHVGQHRRGGVGRGPVDPRAAGEEVAHHRPRVVVLGVARVLGVGVAVLGERGVRQPQHVAHLVHQQVDLVAAGRQVVARRLLRRVVVDPDVARDGAVARGRAARRASERRVPHADHRVGVRARVHEVEVDDVVDHPDHGAHRRRLLGGEPDQRPLAPVAGVVGRLDERERVGDRRAVIGVQVVDVVDDLVQREGGQGAVVALGEGRPRAAAGRGVLVQRDLRRSLAFPARASRRVVVPSRLSDHRPPPWSRPAVPASPRLGSAGIVPFRVTRPRSATIRGRGRAPSRARGRRVGLFLAPPPR